MQSSVTKTYKWSDGSQMAFPQKTFDAIGQHLVYGVQGHAQINCEMSHDPAGAVKAVVSVKAPRVAEKIVWAPMSMLPHIVASMTKDGATITAQYAAFMKDAGLPVSVNTKKGLGYYANLDFEIVGYSVPVPANVPATETPPVPPAAMDAMPIGAARFGKATGTVIDTIGTDITIDGKTVRAAPRSATLTLYAHDYPDNADTARRVHDRDLDKAVETGVVRRELIDGDVWLFFPAL